MRMQLGSPLQTSRPCHSHQISYYTRPRPSPIDLVCLQPVGSLDESEYGLPELLPLGVLAALEQMESKRRVPVRMRARAARRLWREDVAAAAVGAPTPIVVQKLLSRNAQFIK